MITSGSTIKTAISTGLTSVKTDVTSIVNIALPVGVAIMGLFLAIRLGIGFFKSIAH